MGKIIFKTDKDETKEVITNLPAKTYNYTKTDSAYVNAPYVYYIYFDSKTSSVISSQTYKDIDKSSQYKSELKDGEERDIDITLNVRFDALRYKGSNACYVRQITLSQLVLNESGTGYTQINTVSSDKAAYTNPRLECSVSATGWKLKKNSAFYIDYDTLASTGYGGVYSIGTTVYWTVDFNIKEYERKEVTTIKAPTIKIPTIDRAYYKDTLIYSRTS
jgi:hypothetical protein